MKMRLLMLCAGAALCLGQPAAAATQFYQLVYADRSGGAADPSLIDRHYAQFGDGSVGGEGPASMTTASGTFQFSGLDQNFAPATMTYQMSGLASATDGILKASIASSLTGGFYNDINFSDGVPPFIDAPESLTAVSTSAFFDTLSVAGDNLATVRFHLQFDGAIAGDPANGVFSGASLFQYNPYDTSAPDWFFTSTYASLWQASDAGSYSVDLWSNPFAVTNGQASFGFQLETIAEYFLGGMDDPSQPLSHSIDFSHTVKLVGVDGYDGDGNHVRITSAKGSDGYSYLPAASGAPEPATWMLAIAGFGGAGLMLRRRRAPGRA